VEQLPISLYREQLEQALNVANLVRGEKFEMQSEDEQQEQAQEEYKRLVLEGRFPKVKNGK